MRSGQNSGFDEPAVCLIYPELMRGLACRIVAFCTVLFSVAVLQSSAQQAPDSFHWIDFHSERDQSVVAWVTRSLAVEQWTAIREIGVQFDAALVVTTLRANPQGGTTGDSFSVWSASLTTHKVVRLLQGSDLRLLDWLQLAPGRQRELAALYNDCSSCTPSTFFTVFHYDISQHGWNARWLHGSQAIGVHSANPPQGVSWTQVFAVLANPNGDEFAGTWTHFDYGKQKPAEDYVYTYDVDPSTGLDRVQPVSGKQAAAMEQRLCSAQDAVLGLKSGQNSELCQQMLHPQEERDKRKPCRCAEVKRTSRPRQ